MRKALIVIACVIASIFASAEVKVIERSDKKTPEWITGTAEGYIVAAVEAPSIAAARERAEYAIGAQMILSVARSVSANYSNDSRETVTNDGVVSSDSYRSTIAVQGANLPFLKGISLGKAEDIYWVKVRDKTTKQEYYQYYVKYPFFRVEQQMLIADFEKYDAEKMAELDSLEKKFDMVNNIDDVKTAIGQLEVLEAYFFDNVRRERVKSLIGRYRALPKNLCMNGEFTDDTTLKISFSLNGRPFKIYTPLEGTSNCATDVRVVPSNGCYIITFDKEYCLADEENFIDVSTTIEEENFVGKYLIPDDSSKIELFDVIPTGKMLIDADINNTWKDTVTGLSVTISLNNRSGSPFEVKRLELELSDLRNPVVIDNINISYSSKGTVQLKVRYDDTVGIVKQPKSKIAVANGYLFLINKTTGGEEKVKIVLPYSVNWK